MNDETESVVHALAIKAGNASNPDDAMKYAQAALNLSHALGVIANAKKHS